MQVDQPKVSISVIVPVYSGQDYLQELIDRLAAVRSAWEVAGAPIFVSEVILVDDSAIDRSPEIIDEIADQFEWVTALHLSRNFGQHPATVAGILFSAGNWVVTLDEDLQHPPEAIVTLLKCGVDNSADVIYARPVKSVHKNVVRDWGSVGIKRLISWMTGSEHIRYANSFRMMRGEIARSAASVAIHDTYFDIELGFFTNRITSHAMRLVDQRYVATGKSGYKFRSLLAHAWRMIFSSHIRLLRLATIVGAATTLLAMVLALCLLVGNLVWPDFVSVRGWSSQMLAITFFSGVNICLIGIALQYLSTLVLRAHGRPTFFTIDRTKDKLLKAFVGSAS